MIIDPMIGIYTTVRHSYIKEEVKSPKDKKERGFLP